MSKSTQRPAKTPFRFCLSAWLTVLVSLGRSLSTSPGTARSICLSGARCAVRARAPTALHHSRTLEWCTHVHWHAFLSQRRRTKSFLCFTLLANFTQTQKRHSAQVHDTSLGSCRHLILTRAHKHGTCPHARERDAGHCRSIHMWLLLGCCIRVPISFTARGALGFALPRLRPLVDPPQLQAASDIRQRAAPSPPLPVKMW